MSFASSRTPINPVSGTFNFNLTAPFFSTGPIGVPVGACSPPIQVPSGVVTIAEAPQIGVAVEDVTAYSYDQYGNYVNELDSWTPPQQTATVTVVPGGVNLETVATYTNYAAPPGALKICKIAGSKDLIGTPFTFNVTGIAPVQIAAGPPPGGSCQIVGSFPVNSQVTVAEIVPSGVIVSNITVTPPDRGGSKTSNSVVVTIGSGFTEVDFTDISVSHTGSCQPAESLSVLVLNNDVTAYVPRGEWDGVNTGIGVINIEGTSITNKHIATGSDVINSCASNWMTGQTVCTANNANAYQISGTSILFGSPFTTNAVGTINRFSGGDCTNCGISMDGVNNIAVVGMSVNLLGWGGWQILDLSTTPPTPQIPVLTSPSHLISEDSVIDPTRNLILSADERSNYQLVRLSPLPVSYFQNSIGLNEPDSSAEDCSAGIALAPDEAASPSKIYTADINNPTYMANGHWTAPQMIQSLAESNLSVPGSIAVAQGTHIGILGEEFTSGNTITAFQLNAPYDSSKPIASWVTCNLGKDPSGNTFGQGNDPHTLTAYQSPNGANDAIAVIANDGGSEVAIVDLTQMLTLKTDGNHGCCVGGANGCYPTGTLPAGVVTFKAVPTI